MGDTWWAFIARIDHKTLLDELPGSPSDRRMREQHEAQVDDYWHMRHGLTVMTKPKPVTALDKQLAAYAARKRKKAA